MGKRTSSTPAWPGPFPGTPLGDLADAVEQLGVPHRARAALWRLLGAGEAADPYIVAGLSHHDPAVRMGCCEILDHRVEFPDGALEALIEALGDDEARVRWGAGHALVCDRCKRGECRPGEGDIADTLLGVLAGDPNPHRRFGAAYVLVHRFGDVGRVRVGLDAAAAADDDPAVRAAAGGRLDDPVAAGEMRFPRPQRGRRARLERAGYAAS